jgi:hypothetical protein
MKGISEIAKNGGVALLEQISSDLQPRAKPLDPNDIGKLRNALQKYSESSAVYGTTPKHDNDGVQYAESWEKTGEVVRYDGESMSEPLKEALLRPATKQAIIVHVMHLALYLRDTRGKEALALVAKAIADDLGKVSEWAVVEGCRILRETCKWYPAISEILDVVRKKDAELKRQVMLKSQTPSGANAAYEACAERFGRCVAENWFRETELHGKTLLVQHSFRKKEIENRFLHKMEDVFDSVELKG